MTTPTVTTKMLDAIVNRINKLLGEPENAYVDNTPQVGNYHLDMAYGGISLRQHTADGERDVLYVGYVSKKEMQLLLFAFIQGIYVGRGIGNDE